MKVFKVNPRGYCHGVVDAMNLVAKTIADETTIKPIYIVGQIVHNQIITDAFNQSGATTINGKNREEIIGKIDSGTIIITAHGINPKLILKAKEKGLNVVDATCIDVYKTHKLIKRKIKKGYEVIYVGKKNHPEPEGVIGINPKKIHLIESKKDLVDLNLNTDKIIVTNQTTMSLWDTEKLIKLIEKKYPFVEKHLEICTATLDRQIAIVEIAKNADITIVVGDKASNNTNRLVEISEKIAKTKAIRIESLSDLDVEILKDVNINKVAVTSGASTPSIITKQVIDYIERFNVDDSNTWRKEETLDLNRVIPRIRKGEK